jgi:hypothetical protein
MEAEHLPGICSNNILKTLKPITYHLKMMKTFPSILYQTLTKSYLLSTEFIIKFQSNSRKEKVLEIDIGDQG